MFFHSKAESLPSLPPSAPSDDSDPLLVFKRLADRDSHGGAGPGIDSVRHRSNMSGRIPVKVDKRTRHPADETSLPTTITGGVFGNA